MFILFVVSLNLYRLYGRIDFDNIAARKLLQLSAMFRLCLITRGEV